MSNKLNRVGLAPILHQAEELTTPNSALTGGTSLTNADWITRVINLTIPYGNGLATASYSGTGTLTASTTNGVSQQCGIDVPDADTYPAEVHGQIEGSFPVGVLIAPFIGVYAASDGFAAALTDNKLIKRAVYIGDAVQPSGWTIRSYRTPVLISQAPLKWFVHGFRLINTTGADITVDIKQARFGFRGLDSNFNCFDPVR